MSKIFAMANLRSVYCMKTVIYKDCISYVDAEGDVANIINVACDMPVMVSCMI